MSTLVLAILRCFRIVIQVAYWFCENSIQPAKVVVLSANTLHILLILKLSEAELLIYLLKDLELFEKD